MKAYGSNPSIEIVSVSKEFGYVFRYKVQEIASFGQTSLTSYNWVIYTSDYRSLELAYWQR
jgi:hypothetical protein